MIQTFLRSIHSCAPCSQISGFPSQVWEVKAADLSINLVHRAASDVVDPNKVEGILFIIFYFVV